MYDAQGDEIDKMREKVLALKASRAGTLAFLLRAENEFKGLLLSSGAESEIGITKAKAIFDRALEKAKASSHTVIATIASIHSSEFGADKDEAITKQEEVCNRGKVVNDLYNTFMQSMLEASSHTNEPLLEPDPVILVQSEVLPQSSGLEVPVPVRDDAKRQSVACSITSTSSSSRHEREAELLKQRAEDTKRRAELEKREAALLEAEANIERQRREVLADRRIVEAEALAAEARIEATYASVCGSEFGEFGDTRLASYQRMICRYLLQPSEIYQTHHGQRLMVERATLTQED